MIDGIVRTLLFLVGLILCIGGVSGFVVMLRDSRDRYFPSPAPALGIVVGIGLLLLGASTGSVMIYGAFTAAPVVMR